MILGSAARGVEIDDPGAFARQRLASMKKVEDVYIVSGGPVQLGGLAGYEVLALARDKATQIRVTVYQVFAQDETHYYSLRGTVGRENQDEFLPQFLEIVKSFRRES